MEWAEKFCPTGKGKNMQKPSQTASRKELRHRTVLSRISHIMQMFNRLHTSKCTEDTHGPTVADVYFASI